MIPNRQRDLLQCLWAEGPLSRWELHERTGIRPNTVGSDTASLLDDGIIRECEPTSQPRTRQGEPEADDKTSKKRRLRGRPRVPLEIDTQRRHVLGLAIRPGRVEIAKLNLQGKLVEAPASRKVKEPGTIIRTARDLLQEEISDATLCIGLATPGFVDPHSDSILFSSAWPGFGEISLAPIHEVASTAPYYVLENDMHALAARWLLTHRAGQSDDVLLVYFDDGQVGSAVLIAGRPNRGCVTAANELGHTRLPVETDRCYCGRVGCLERVFSTDFLRKQGVAEGTLAELAAAYHDDDEAMSQTIGHFAMGVANAVNFIRPNRLVLVSELTGYANFSDALEESVRSQTLKEIMDRVQIERWQQPAAQSAETAGWLGLASLYCEGWLPENGREKAEAIASAEN